MKVIVGAIDLQATGRICVVDDDADVRKALERTLSRAGHEVVTCESVEKAIAVLEAGRDIEIVVSDLHMAVVDGHRDWSWTVHLPTHRRGAARRDGDGELHG